MTLCIPNGVPTERKLLSVDGSFLFRQVFKKSLSCEYSRSGRKIRKEVV